MKLEEAGASEKVKALSIQENMLRLWPVSERKRGGKEGKGKSTHSWVTWERVCKSQGTRWWERGRWLHRGRVGCLGMTSTLFQKRNDPPPKIYLFLFYIYECFACICVYHVHAHSIKKMASDPLELELEVIVSYRTCARN